uniref:Alpha/beta hydrolase fold-3 domain-containing protein n=1 Tax=Alexandrium monilatum TaxID=311494 RepID=A0A7S4PXN5_9DINO
MLESNMVSASPGLVDAPLDCRQMLDACRKELEALKAELASLGQFHVELYKRVVVRRSNPIRLSETQPAGPSEPIVPQELWERMPNWIRLDGDRGHLIPALAEDPLFWGKGDPCLLPFLPAKRPWGRGIAVLVPGGNYEFLTPEEGEPLARWLAEDLGIPVCVLRYRLLPAHTLGDAASDLRAALRYARHLAQGGPVAVFGFSAGAHLAALVHAEATAGERKADVQIFLYPVITVDDWFSESTSGFFRIDEKSEEVKGLAHGQEFLVPGPMFVPPPPTFMVSSTGDSICPPSRHGDLYAEGLAAAGVPFEHLRGDFGDHGFSHHDFWRGPCLRWLRGLGFGHAPRALV